MFVVLRVVVGQVSGFVSFVQWFWWLEQLEACSCRSPSYGGVDRGYFTQVLWIWISSTSSAVCAFAFAEATNAGVP